MIDLYDFTTEVLGVGERIADGDGWSVSERRRRHAEYCRAMAALQRRERRERLAREIAVVKAAQKAGLTVKRATIAGVPVEFGQPAPETVEKAPVNGPAVADADINEWDRDLGIQTPSLRQ